MFEAYGRNKYTSTGVIQWMLNNGWPSLIWHLYDYYLVPAGGYFGTKKAMEPVHVQYSYDDNSVAVVNSTYEALKGVKVSAKIYNIDAHGKSFPRCNAGSWRRTAASRHSIFPKWTACRRLIFCACNCTMPNGKMVSDNFYWLSTKADTLDWAKQTRYGIHAAGGVWGSYGARLAPASKAKRLTPYPETGGADNGSESG